MVSEIKNSIIERHGLDRAIWISLLTVVTTTIFSIALLQLSLGVLAALCIAKVVRSSPATFQRTSLDLPMAVFIIGRVVSIIFSTHPAVSVSALYIEIIFYAAFFVFTNTLQVDKQNETIILVQILLLAAVVAAGIGIIKYGFGISKRASSLTSGPYTFSLYLIAVLPFALFLVKDSRVFRNARYAYAAIGIIIMGIVFSLNRLHWVAMAATLVFTAAITKDRIPLAVLALVLATSILAIPEVAQRAYLTITVFSHTGGRDTLWQGAGMIYAEHPFVGFGPRTFREIFPLMSKLWDPRTGSWHNDFLQVYMESGLVGLVPFIWLIGAALSSAIKTLRTSQGKSRNFILPLMVAFSIFVAAGGMLDTVVGVVFRLFLAAIALMATTAVVSKPERKMKGYT